MLIDKSTETRSNFSLKVRYSSWLYWVHSNSARVEAQGKVGLCWSLIPWKLNMTAQSLFLRYVHEMLQSIQGIKEFEKLKRWSSFQLLKVINIGVVRWVCVLNKIMDCIFDKTLHQNTIFYEIYKLFSMMKASQLWSHNSQGNTANRVREICDA